MSKSFLYAAGLACTVFLAGCGGGGGGSNSPDDGNPDPGGGGNPTPPTTIEGSAVAGPLDPVQTQLSSGVLDPLSSAFAGTPLELVTGCADAIVVHDTLDIADTVLASLEAAAAGGTAAPDPQALADSLSALGADLVQLLQGLAADGAGCLTATASLDNLQAALDALEGTPLAPLADALAPVLEQLVAALGSDGDGGSEADDPQLSTVAALIEQLNVAFQGALAQIPADAYEAPVVGGTVLTVAAAIDDLSTLLNGLLNYDAATSEAALQALINNTVGNLLTQVLPLQDLEEQAGQPGAITTPILTNTAQLAALIASSIGTTLDPAFNDLLDGALSPLLDPVENDILPTVLGPIIDALTGGGELPDLGTGPLAGTPLAPVVDLVTGLLGTLLGDGSGTGDPTPDDCAFAAFPLLSALCNVLP